MEIVVSPTANKHLGRIAPHDRKKAAKKIEALKSNPLAGKQLQGEHAGQRGIYAWPLRIIYIFDSQSQVLYIVDVDYRGGVYKKG